MSKDYKNLKIMMKETIRMRVLQNINSILESMGKNIHEYALTDIHISYDEQERGSKEIEEELHIPVTEQDLLTVSTLNQQQKYAYDIILQRILSGKHGSFFIEGPGGTGKTYLYRALLATLRSRGFIALATVTSGIEAYIMPGGRNAHSRFKILINIETITSCGVNKQSNVAKLLTVAKLIIWDEASMSRKQAIEAFNKMLQDITENNLPFGGKVVVFCGDFRQVLPVVLRTKKKEVIDASLVTSELWPVLDKIRLTENMRAKFDPSFSESLLRIGNGTEEMVINDKIRIPSCMLMPFKDEITSQNALIEAIFPNLRDNAHNSEFMSIRTILTPKNEFVDEINDLLIDRFPGTVVTYYSFDSVLDSTEQIQEDFLNGLTPNGLPPHQLRLKINYPIILLRNIDPSVGLCNRTRLV